MPESELNEGNPLWAYILCALYCSLLLWLAVFEPHPCESEADILTDTGIAVCKTYFPSERQSEFESSVMVDRLLGLVSLIAFAALYRKVVWTLIALPVFVCAVALVMGWDSVPLILIGLVVRALFVDPTGEWYGIIITALAVIAFILVPLKWVAILIGMILGGWMLGILIENLRGWFAVAFILTLILGLILWYRDYGGFDQENS